MKRSKLFVALNEILPAAFGAVVCAGCLVYAVCTIRGCWLEAHPEATIVEFAGIPFGSKYGKWDAKTMRGFSKPKILATPISGKAYSVEIRREISIYDIGKGTERIDSEVAHVIAVLKEKYPSCSAKFIEKGQATHEAREGEEVVYWQMEDRIRPGRKIIVYRVPQIEREDLRYYGRDTGRFQSARIVAIDEELFELARSEQNKLDKAAL